MALPAAPLAFSLFATICINGTLHGESKTLCNEFQISHFASVEDCNKAVERGEVSDWLKSVGFLTPRLMNSRCGPREKDSAGDDDI